MIKERAIIKTLEKILLIFLIMQILFTFIQTPLSKTFIVKNLLYTLMGFALIFIFNYIYLETHNKFIQSFRYLILFIVIILNIFSTQSTLFFILFLILAIDIILEQKDAKKIGIYLSSILIFYILIIEIYNPKLIYLMKDMNISIAISYFLIFMVAEYNSNYLSEIQKINNKILEQEEIKNNEKKFLVNIGQIVNENTNTIKDNSDSSSIYTIQKFKEYILNIISTREEQKGILDININTISLNQIFQDVISKFREYHKDLNIDYQTNIADNLFILMDAKLFNNILNILLIFSEEENVQNIHINLISIPDFIQIQISFDKKTNEYLKNKNISQIQNEISWIQMLSVYSTELGGYYNIKPNGIDLNFVKSLIQ